MIDTQETITMMFIMENLKRLRRLHKLKPSDVAKVIEKSRQGYMNYEQGLREMSIVTLIRLSLYYNVSIDEIVGNPYALNHNNKVTFTNYEYIDGVLEQSMNKTISTQLNDVIIVREDEKHSSFFWKTNANNPGHEMLFLYCDVPYISKVYFDKLGSGFFFVQREAKFFSKEEAKSIYFIGVKMAKLEKDFNLDHFF